MIIRNYSFHRVHPQKDYLWDPMHPKLFEKVIKYISRNFNAVQLEHLYLNKFDNNKQKAFATIIFDDGYKDNIEYAAPILKKNNCPASFYVVTDSIDKNLPTWTYILDYLFQHTNKLSLDINIDDLPDFPKKTKWLNEKERLTYARILKPFLKKLKHQKREFILNEIYEDLNDVEIPNDLMMTWDDLRELKKEGFIIGSHSKTHPLLDSIEDRRNLIIELNESAEKIKKELNEFPITISYPNGNYNDIVIEDARKCGYKLGLTVKQKFFNSNKDSLFEIPRVELYNESWFKTKLRISGTLEKIKTIIKV